MDVLQRGRRPVRRQVRNLTAEIMTECQAADPDLDKIRELMELLSTANTGLQEANQKVVDKLVDDKATDAEVDAEYDEVAVDGLSVIRARHAAEKILDKGADRRSSPTASVSSFSTAPEGRQKKTYKLPKIEIKKFNGDLKGWLGFWAQFSKIHEDQELTNADKFQYLVQSMTKGSRALEVVTSYPQSSENYEKAVEALKRRFGRDVLLVEVYVRELLKMVIHITNAKGKITLSSMYDKLESHLRALESLGVTTDKCAAILFPLVESCLPEETLKAWHRSSWSRKDEDENDPKTERLYCLMEFLREEVEGEERIQLARQGFGFSSKNEEMKTPEVPREDPVPTAHGLVSGEYKKKKCIFCEGHHESPLCVKALRMSMEEKREKVRNAKVCYKCLNVGHMMRDCKVIVQCAVCTEGKPHHTVMCAVRDKNVTPAKAHDRQSSVDSKKDDGESTTSVEMANQSVKGDILLQTLMVKVINNNKEKIVRLMFDSGSQRTYIKTQLAAEMGYSPIGTENIMHVLFGGSTTDSITHKKYRIKMKSMDGKNTCDLVVVDQDKICGKIPRLQRGPWLKELSEKRLWITDFGNDDTIPEIEILVGGDAYSQLMTGRTCKLKCGLMAHESVLGWTLIGAIPSSVPVKESTTSIVTSMLVCDRQLSDIWNLEALGITDPAASVKKEDREAQAKEHFRRTVSVNEKGRYEVSLPWTCGQEKLPTNRAVAEKRLKTTTKKLRDNGRYDDYQNVFDSWLAEGVIEAVTDTDNQRAHYLPHRAIFKESKTTPVRPVYDASCKTGRFPSLNQCLEKGPNLLEVIPSLLLRFRVNRIGVISDIRKAFLMISIASTDRDFLRFLWWEKNNPSKIQIYRHDRVVFGLTCSPFLLGAVIEFHLEKTQQYQETARKLLKSLYVDNCVTSVDTVDELQQFKMEATELMKSAQMDLRMWEFAIGNASSSDLLHYKEESCEISDEDIITNVLGLKWNKLTDILYCEIPKFMCSEIVTKRVILSSAQRVFDPMGFLAPVTLRPKLLLQKAWKIKAGWDEELPVDIRYEFQKWLEGFLSSPYVEIPRWMAGGAVIKDNLQVHCFCDASKYAYAAVIFLRNDVNGEISVQMMQCKTRVAPVESLTINRLELMACLIGSRLCNAVKAALDWQDVRTFYWSDSTTALAWIKRCEEWTVFIHNRVEEIRGMTKQEEWHHVPGIMNPADLPSRGCSMTQLRESRWWEGPTWLKVSEEWPGGDNVTDEDAILSEKRKTVKVNVVGSVQVPWYMKATNSYFKVIRLVAWMRRFCNNTRRRRLIRKIDEDIPELSVAELDEAEKTVIPEVKVDSSSSSESEVVTKSGRRVKVPLRLGF